MKRFIYFLLSMTIVCSICNISVKAAESMDKVLQEEPELLIYLEYNITQGDSPFLMAEVQGITLEEDEYLKALEASVTLDDGEIEIIPSDNMGDWTKRGKVLDRCLLYPLDPVLLRYSKQECHSIKVSILFIKCDESGEVIGEPMLINDTWERPVSGTEFVNAKNQMIINGYPANMMTGSLFQKKVQIQVTGEKSAYSMTKELPVVLAFCDESNGCVWLEEYDYPVIWNEQPDYQDDQTIIYSVKEVNRPASESAKLKFYYKDCWYQVDPSEEDAFPAVTTRDFPFGRINYVVNLVEDTYIPPVNLTSDTEGNLGILLEYKPTDASKIEVYLSDDGEKTWTYVADVDLGKYPVSGVPKEQGYQANIFTADQVQQYTSKNGGFALKFKIYGGPLGNQVLDGDTAYTMTDAVVWPSDYVDNPPLDSSGNQGSGGNKGDVGTDNSGSPEGIRPGTEEKSESDENASKLIEIIPAPQTETVLQVQVSEAIVIKEDQTQEERVQVESMADNEMNLDESAVPSAEFEQEPEEVIPSTSEEKIEKSHSQKRITIVITMICLIAIAGTILIIRLFRR